MDLGSWLLRKSLMNKLGLEERTYINSTSQFDTLNGINGNSQAYTNKDDLANADAQLEARKYAEEQQEKLWNREDEIRKETQEREDNAYQRAVKDMQLAGINPNLMDVQPAQSGGGITQASKIDLSNYNTKLKIASDYINDELERKLKKLQLNEKTISDISSIFIKALSLLGME